MNELNKPPTNPATHTAHDWDQYWRGAGEVGAWTAGGARHPAIRAFWTDFFTSAREAFPSPRLLDVASGSGAVVECAMEVFAGAPIDAWSLDSSEAAIEGLRDRFPGLTGLVCDARSIPPEVGRFELVTSQFGVEYAGLEALGSLPGLLAPEGRIALLLHCSRGAIQTECAASLDAVNRMQASGFVALAGDMFDAGFAAARGADRVPYDEAASRLAPALKAIEGIVSEYGQDVAAGTIARLYGDVATIHSRLPHYDREEVLGWLERMNSELDAYAGRMTSMLEAALDGPAFERVCRSLTSGGCVLDNAGPFKVTDQDAPLGWALVGHISRPGH